MIKYKKMTKRQAPDRQKLKEDLKRSLDKITEQADAMLRNMKTIPKSGRSRQLSLDYRRNAILSIDDDYIIVDYTAGKGERYIIQIKRHDRK